MKVVGWTNWEDPATDCDGQEYLDALYEEIREKKIKISGAYHQGGVEGVPVFDDGKVLRVSMRSWGEIMAEIWGGDYTDYAWVL